MAEHTKGYFLFSWTIKGFNLRNESYCISPEFKAGSLGGSEWRFDIYRRMNNISCFLTLMDHNGMNANSQINCMFELVNSKGQILKISKHLSLMLRKSTTSIKYDLIDVNELLTEQRIKFENCLTVMCHMRYANNTVLLASTHDAFISCEAETNIINITKAFYWIFKIEYFEHWTTRKNITVNAIPIEIIFKYVSDKIEIEISSSIEDDWEHKVMFIAELKDTDNKGIFRKSLLYNISINNKRMLNSPLFSKQLLEKAQCFNRREIRVNFYFTHEKSSKLNYNKNLKSNQKFRLENDDYCSQLLSYADEQNRIYESELDQTDNGSQLFQSMNSEKESDADCSSYLHQDLYSLFLDKTFADVQLRVGNEIILAHKSILAARSPVFRTMFGIYGNVGIKAALRTFMGDQCVDIPDIEVGTLKLFLEYIYTGKISKMDEGKATSLLVAGRRFLVTPLAKMCVKFLKSVMKLENACRLLLIAHKEKQDELKSFAINFIAKKSETILSSPEWLQLKMAHAALGTEVLEKLDALRQSSKEESLPGSSKDLQDPTSGANSRKSQSGAESLKDGLKENKESEKSSSLVVEPEGRQMKTL